MQRCTHSVVHGLFRTNKLRTKKVHCEMMNYPGHAAAGPWYPDDAGEAAAGDTTSFADLIASYSSTDDLFDLAWCHSGTTMPPPAYAWTPQPEVRFDPPSEDEMAAWLHAIVKGDELAFSDDDGRDGPAKRPSDDTSTTDKKEKLPMTEGMSSTKKEMRKPSAGGSSRRSHHGEAHKLTEKRRRHKINERFRTLQQLVPGCDDKSNQVATLDQTIQYMRSLQHHVKGDVVRRSSYPSAAGSGGGAAYPVVQPQCVPPVAPAAAPMMVLAPVPAATMVVPFGAMVELLPHYPAAAPVMMAAAAAPLYPAAAASHHPQGSSSSNQQGKGGGSRSMIDQQVG